MPREGPKPPNCCRSNTDGTKTCWRYYVCHAFEAHPDVFGWLIPGVALIYQGDIVGPPAVLRWHFVHNEILPAIFRSSFFDKSKTDTGGTWRGQVKSALLSGLWGINLCNINAPVPPSEHYNYPLNKLFGPEDPDFIPHGMTFTGFNTRSAILSAFPDCDLRMLPT